MVSGMAWILIGLALLAGVGLTLVWEHYRSRALLLEGALDALPIAAQIVLDGRRVICANAACRAQFEDAVTPLPDLLRRRAFDEAAGAALERLIRAPGGRAELALAAAPGEPGWWEVIARPVANPPRQAPGAKQGSKPSGHMLWLCRDITAERRAEAALRPLVQALEGPAEAIGALASGALPSQADSRRFEAQLAQTLRLKAVGQLAGGIAHDFNNLLTVMIGFCDLLLLRHPPGDQSFADIMQIRQNAERAANLVRQLLAYSGRQTLQPRVVSLADVLAELAPLLRRLVGRHIELKLEQGGDLDPVLVDPGQLEQVITNLVVNARDAMPAGGSLTIRTDNLKLVAAFAGDRRERAAGRLCAYRRHRHGHRHRARYHRPDLRALLHHQAGGGRHGAGAGHGLWHRQAERRLSVPRQHRRPGLHLPDLSAAPSGESDLPRPARGRGGQPRSHRHRNGHAGRG